MRANSEFERSDSLSGSPATMAVSLGSVLESVRFFQCDELITRRMASSVDVCQPGELVVFRLGVDDPVAFGAVALARGAAGVLTDQLLPCPLPQAIVPDVESATWEVAHQLHQHPGRQLIKIGVVGCSGKTTTALMVASVLRSIGVRVGYETSLGTSDGKVQSASEVSPATGVELISRLAAARDSACGAIVIEIPSDLPLSGLPVDLDLLVVSGISTDGRRGGPGKATHFGPDPIEIALEALRNPDGVVIVPADHPKLLQRVEQSGHRSIRYGIRRDADVTAKVFEQQPGETTWMVCCGDETAVLETGHCGETMAMNQLAAITVAMLLDQTLPEAIEAVRRTPTIPGRMQRLTSFDTAAVVLDNGGSAERLAGTLRCLRQQRFGGKLWCIYTLGTGDLEAGSDRGENQTCQSDSLSDQGRVIERYADRIVITATDTAKPRFLQSAHQVLDGFKHVAMARLVADRRRAIQWAMQHADPCDTILIVGGTHTGSAAGDRGEIQRLEKLVDRCRQSGSVRRVSPPSTIPIWNHV